MSKRSLRQLEALVESAKHTDMSNLDQTVHELIRFFISIKERIASSDENERAQALKDLDLLQEQLDEQAQAAAKQSGYSQEELKDFMRDRKNFSESEWQTLEKARQEMQDYEKELKKPTKPAKSAKKPAKKKPPRSKWISG